MSSTPKSTRRRRFALRRTVDRDWVIGHAGAPWELDWCSVYSARALTLPDAWRYETATGTLERVWMGRGAGEG